MTPTHQDVGDQPTKRGTMDHTEIVEREDEKGKMRLEELGKLIRRHRARVETADGLQKTVTKKAIEAFEKEQDELAAKLQKGEW